MPLFDPNAHPHRRYNPLTQRWVLVSPQRTQRPWQGQVETPAQEASLAFDSQCYLCPGNVRASGARNPQYPNTFVFENDFAALRLGTPSGSIHERELLIAESEAGQCRVVCFSPRHDLTISRMAPEDIRVVVDTWCEQFLELAASANVRAIQIFENRGVMMGCSNAHPHGQIWANEHIPEELAREVATQQTYFAEHQASLLEDYLKLELEKQQRLVCANEHFVAVVPFWAVWPYETLLISRRPASCLPDLSDSERDALAHLLRELTIRYDNLFEVSFPYTMGLHQRPTDQPAYPGFHLHAHFYPPLLRSATIKKFMVGYELLAMPQRDITPELAAQRLRDLPATHYLQPGP